jgi:pimeloyl-ACP methyl ester carboxylesterase
MHRSRILTTAVAVLLVLGQYASAPPARASTTATLALHDCRIEGPRGTGSVAARCGELRVAEDPAEPSGRQIGLAVAVVPAISTRAEPDPLFMIAGGPGQGARESFVPALAALGSIRNTRDVVLVDQRGTGDSQPLDCDMPEDTLDDMDTPPEELAALARTCLSALPGDPRFYTTSVAVQDLDAVREALGYARINLYGASYGTRVAQHYVRRHPERVRAVVLDGVVPPGLALGPALATDAEASLRQVFADCAAMPDCKQAFGDLGAAFDALRETLAAGPQQVRFTDPVTGELREERFGRGELALAVRILSYAASSRALLPLLLHEAAGGNLAPLAAQAAMIAEQFEGMLAIGMHNAVSCTEDIPFIDPAAVDRAALGRSYLGSAMLDGLQAMCGVWPRGVLDDDLRAPLSSTVPALLFSGSADPVTPPAYAATAATGFSQHLNLVFAGQGHTQLAEPCALGILRRFLQAGSIEGLDTGCVAQLRQPPFFLNFNGSAS